MLLKALGDDAQGRNNSLVRSAKGERGAVVFNFDEWGGGHLAYELAVYPWSLHPRTPGGAWSDKAAGAVATLHRGAAVLAVGEYAGRVSVWDSQAMPTDYLRRQAKMLSRREGLELPV